MSYMKIPNVATPVFYLTNDDAIKNNDTAFITLYEWARPICKALEIECPIITWTASITQQNDITGVQTNNAGMSFHKEDIPDIPDSLIIISFESRDFYLLNATLAHELRHVWQHKQPNYKKRIHAQGIRESAKDPEEIDADAFAIWFISTSDKYNIESAAEFFCSNEKMLYPEYFEERINRAHEIKKNIENKYSNDNSKQKKRFFNSLLAKIKNL